jgi:HEAT repeat protein
MRFLLVVAAGFIWFVAGAGNAPGQKKDKEKPPEKKTTITEIGGKSIQQWIKEIPSKDRSKGENAIRTVLLFHPDQAYEAVPVIMAELKRKDIILDISIRVNAVIALGVILGGANDPDSKVIHDAVTLLIRFLDDGQAIVKYRAAQALARIAERTAAPEAKGALPKLIAMSRDTTTWENRQAATAAIGFVARDPKKAPGDEVFNALIKRLGDTSSQVRLAAIQSLTWIGGPAGPKRQAQLVQDLEKITLKDPEPTIRIWTHMAIMSIEKKIQKNHLNKICDFLNRKVELAARIQAAQSLGTLGPDACNKETVKALCDALKDPEPAVVYWSMFALARFGKHAQAAIKCLQPIIDDPNQLEAVKVTAQETIDIILGKEKGKEKQKDKVAPKGK